MRIFDLKRIAFCLSSFKKSQLTNAYSRSGDLTLNPCKLFDMTIPVRIGGAAGKRTVMNYIMTPIQKSLATAFRENRGKVRCGGPIPSRTSSHMRG